MNLYFLAMVGAAWYNRETITKTKTVPLWYTMTSNMYNITSCLKQYIFLLNIVNGRTYARRKLTMVSALIASYKLPMFCRREVTYIYLNEHC